MAEDVQGAKDPEGAKEAEVVKTVVAAKEAEGYEEPQVAMEVGALEVEAPIIPVTSEPSFNIQQV